MSRYILLTCLYCSTASPISAAEPKPVWELNTNPKGARIADVKWVEFTHDGKTLVAETRFVDLKSGTIDLGQVTTWDTTSRKVRFSFEFVDRLFLTGLHQFAMTEENTLVSPLIRDELQLADGKMLRSPQSQVPGIMSRGMYYDGVWVKHDSRQVLRLGIFKSSTAQRFSMRVFIQQLLPVTATDKERNESVTVPSEILRFREGQTGIRAVAVSSKLQWVAISWREGGEHGPPLTLCRIELGDKLKVTEVATVPVPHPGPISAMRFHPDGKILASGSDDSSIALWDISKAGKDWKPLAVISAKDFTVSGLEYSPDGRILAAGTFDRENDENLFLIDVREKKLIAAHKTRKPISALAFSPDGKLLATGHAHGSVKVWDVDTLHGK